MDLPIFRMWQPKSIASVLLGAVVVLATGAGAVLYYDLGFRSGEIRQLSFPSATTGKSLWCAPVQNAPTKVSFGGEGSPILARPQSCSGGTTAD